MTTERKRTPAPLRFAMKCQVNTLTGCWEWTASTKRNGYAQFNPGGGRIVSAHRWSYEFHVGPIPAGLDLDHLCRVRHCVNPAHLEPVSRRTNLLRGETVTARNAARTHCPHGHPYDAGNTHIGRNGGRWCKACWARQREVRRAKRIAS